MDESQLGRQPVAELRSSVRALQCEVIALQYRQLAVLAELESRGFEGLGLRGLPDLIQVELNVTRRAAKGMAQQVARFAERRSVTGEVLEPVYPIAAERFAAGELSGDHAGVVADVIETLPPPVRVEHAAHVETTLVELAAEHDPRTLKQLGQRILAHLDPDGAAPTERTQAAARGLTLRPGPDDTVRVEGLLTPACAAVWQTALTPLATQRQPDELGADTRSIAQRWHDAFETAGRMLLDSAKLPSQAGLPAQLIITVGLHDLERRAGQATTHHGGTLSIREALRLAADTNVIPAVLDQELGIMAYGRGKRLAGAGQRKALFARDRGCTFPGCARTAAESEIHHATDWVAGGPTDLDNLAVTCGYHNSEAPRQGWSTVFIDGRPHWQPPVWRDPDQRPRRNWLHHPEQLAHHRTPQLT
ncbi:MAG TPA: DUF222 domain-containing protein [Jatrophihabitans sp.]|nr:DUF222 domain-containing protein [Jatrophihabitans sp.]